MKSSFFALIFLLSASAAGAQYYGQFRYKPAVGGGEPTTVCAFVTSGVNDTEEFVSDGSCSNNSSDLELGHDASERQWVGVRFTGMNIPAGATITEAKIQWEVDNTKKSDPCSVDFYAEEGVNPADFTSEANNCLTSRDRTETKATWTLTGQSWTPVGGRGADQLSVNFSSVIQEVVDHPSYQSTWAVVVLIEGIQGEREAESYEGSTTAVELCVTYTN